MTQEWFSGFKQAELPLAHGPVAYRSGGMHNKPALMLVHGFPQTHVMWERVVKLLEPHFFLVLPDLRGYGDSAKLPGEPQHEQASKRALAQDLMALADHLQLGTFYLCGHDRGGRVAHRLALDHPTRVAKLCVIDIAPTLDMYASTDRAFASAYYHWFHLIQPAPLPENMIAGSWQTYLHAKLGGWGSAGLGYIQPRALLEYERCFQDPATLHAMCEDYRASAGIDLVHDRASRQAGETIVCDTLVLWGERGVVHRMFRPLELWQAQCAGTVSGHTMPAGHFIPEELSAQTAQHLKDFFSC